MTRPTDDGKPCPQCGGEMHRPERGDPQRACGVRICWTCGYHDGLCRCFCGWTLSGGNGYAELAEMGEQIEEDHG